MSKQNKKLTIKDVYASINIGGTYSSPLWVASYILMFVGAAITFVVTILFAILIEDKIVSVCMAALCVLCLITGISISVPVEQNKKKIALWLKDAVILGARCKSLGTQFQVRARVGLTATAIEVKFYYNGKMYKRRSERKGKLLYLFLFNKYADKGILIAYSPKYDKVMLLK